MGTPNDGPYLCLAELEVTCYPMLEFLLQVEKDIVVTHIQLILPPQETRLLEVCDNIGTDYVAIRRSLPTQHDFPQSFEPRLMLPTF